jgi:hypothetical protein
MGVWMSIAASNPGPLLGRDAEIELLASLLDGIQDGGAALVLSPVVRDRLLREAAGNPLALMELPITAARLEPIAPGSPTGASGIARP